jgi:hypothetical protein
LNKELLLNLKNRVYDWRPDSTLLGDVFLRLAPFLKIYSEFGINYDNAVALCNTLMKERQSFANKMKELKDKSGSQLNLQSMLIMPVQR